MREVCYGVIVGTSSVGYEFSYPYVREINFVCAWKWLLIEIKDYSYGVAEHCEVDEQVPYEVVVSKALLGVEPSTDGVEDAACTNQHQKWGRGVVPKEWEEDHNHPSHNQVNCQTYRRY